MLAQPTMPKEVDGIDSLKIGNLNSGEMLFIEDHNRYVYSFEVIEASTKDGVKANYIGITGFRCEVYLDPVETLHQNKLDSLHLYLDFHLTQSKCIITAIEVIKITKPTA